ncbi:hypothetical protein LJK88_14940 [Paenibacillus sp. P26]|nr:hypothetical protein LJK88_14940 [Paenibacillus sp. P26]
MLYPIVTEHRSVIDLSGIWKFKLDTGIGFQEKWYEQELASPMPMAVPSSYNDIGVNGDIRNHVGWVWYERSFAIPKALAGERIVLRFGSATHTAIIYLNGEPVMEHRGGFTPFEAEINGFLQPGTNRLTVAVNNIVDHSTPPVGHYVEKEVEGLGKVVRNSPNFDFFNYAGLHRPVKIYTTPRVHLEDVAIITELSGNTGVVRYQAS